MAAADPQVLDFGALVLYFPQPNTVSGEDILELHVHGGPAIVKAVLEAIQRCTKQRGIGDPLSSRVETLNIRPAEPGEFTKRAFYNNRIDLTQAEALGESLSAETEQQRRLAVTGAGHSLALRYEEWRAQLLHARGELEALIDFSEDQHFEESSTELIASITAQVESLKRRLELHVSNASKGELLRQGISVALLGAPNAGKSSLLNRIVGREAAIVSREEGTTRDIVDVGIDLNGWFVRLGDMAGLRTMAGQGISVGQEGEIGDIEKEGMRRARVRALESDIVVVVLSLEEDLVTRGLTPYIEKEVLVAVKECEEAGKAILVVLNKTDKIQTALRSSTGNFVSQIHDAFPNISKNHIFFISCHSETLAASSIGNDTIKEHNEKDPGNIQAFLQGLTALFATLTHPSGCPSMRSDTNSTTITMPSCPQAQDPTHDQSYWTQSLSVTHRQATYLTSCLGHLNDYLVVCTCPTTHTSCPTPALSPSSSPTPHEPYHGSGNDHYCDGQDDLVGEKLPRHPDRDAEVGEQVEEMEVDIVAAAEHLRFAAACLGKITGKGEDGDVEDVLGVVFEKYVALFLLFSYVVLLFLPCLFPLTMPILLSPIYKARVVESSL